MNKARHPNSPDEKEYYLSVAFRANWMSARSFCKSNGMDLVAIEDKNEEQYFISKCKEKMDLFESFTQIGGVSNAVRGNESWYWITSVREIRIDLNLEKNETDQKKNCLQLVKNPNRTFSYQRTNCFGTESQSFVCQKNIYKKIPSDIRKWNVDILALFSDFST